MSNLKKMNEAFYKEGFYIDESKAKVTFARECIICDKAFEVNMVGDNRLICPKCKRFLKKIVELNAEDIEEESKE